MKCALTLLLLAMAFFGKGQSPLVLTHVSEENGLSDNHVTCVFKDEEDLLWVGTKDGLNLLDGSTIQIFKNNPSDSNSITNNYITGITQDHNGFIWISTADGFCCFDKNTQRFVNFRYYGPSRKPIGGLSNPAIDEKQSIWFGTSSGLFEYNIRQKQITQYVNHNTNFGTDTNMANRVNQVMVASNGTVWLATMDGLWNFSPQQKLYTKIIHRQNDPFYHPLCYTVYEDQHKNIWAGFWSAGLKKYDPGTHRVHDYGGQFNHSYAITAITGAQLNGDPNRLWLNGKLLVFDMQTAQYSYLNEPLLEKNLPELRPVYSSSDGWVWLASDAGLYIYNPKLQVFRHEVYDRPITSQSVVFAAYKNNILVGGQDKEFLKLKDDSGKVIKDYGFLCQNSAATLHILLAGQDECWLGTSNGILHTNLGTGYQRWYRHSDTDSTSLPRDFITAIFIDSRQNTWIFPWRKGIWQLDPQTGRCKKMIEGFITEDGKLKNLVISNALEDAAGNIWMNDLDEGIILYEPATNRFSKPFEKEIGTRAHAARIFSLNGYLYSALYYAVIKWDPQTRKLQQFPLPPELKKTITDIYPDKLGNWWLTTASGLISFDEKENHFRKFTSAEGLYQNDVDASLFCQPNGVMIIGSPNYCSYFDPGKLNYAMSRHASMSASFYANNRMVNMDYGKTIYLSHEENNIVIRWGLHSYTTPFSNQYYYQLIGIDSTWRYNGNKGELQCANLSPGKYKIIIRATTANETEKGNILVIDFVIRPPYWKTLWFKLGVLLAVGILFFLVVRYISQRNLKEKLLRLEKTQAIEKERNRISRDMHDDLGSGLTKIAILSEVVKKQLNEPDKAKTQLENISSSSRELVDSLQDIIWVLNPKNDTLESLASYVREYTLKFFEPFGTQVIFHYPDQFAPLKLSEETRRNIFLVIKETLHNISKHANCQLVTIGIQQSGQQVSINITDDGKGFDVSTVRAFGNGLSNMKNRMEQVNGSFTITGNKPSGTVTTLVIPG